MTSQSFQTWRPLLLWPLASSVALSHTWPYDITLAWVEQSWPRYMSLETVTPGYPHSRQKCAPWMTSRSLSPVPGHPWPGDFVKGLEKELLLWSLDGLDTVTQAFLSGGRGSKDQYKEGKCDNGSWCWKCALMVEDGARASAGRKLPASEKARNA